MGAFPLGKWKKVLNILTDTETTIPATLASFESKVTKCVAKTDGAYLTGNDDLFVITVNGVVKHPIY